jgi:YhcH/YjgK/YiaL family protein
LRPLAENVVVDSGEEVNGWFPVAGLEVKTPYDPEKDVEFYHRPGAGPARVNVSPGTFVVLFPWDAHMPQLAVEGVPTTVKKVVVKIRAGLFGVASAS